MLTDRRTQKARIGETVEYKAVIWLIEEGYEVFRNVSRIGPIDIVIVDGSGNTIKIDVKKCTDGTRNSKGKIYHQQKKNEQKELGVVFLYYDEYNDVFAWSIEEIYAKAGKPYKKIMKNKIKKESLRVTLDPDKEFSGLSEVARYYGINEHSLRERRRREGAESLEDTINVLLNKTKQVMVFGNLYSSRTAACRQLNVNSRSVEERMRERGTGLEETIQHFIDRNWRRANVTTQ